MPNEPTDPNAMICPECQEVECDPDCPNPRKLARDERDGIDWLSKVQAECKVTITDDDVGWATRAFLAVVLVSGKYGRRAGEATLAKAAAERRAAITAAAQS
jgi:hypothetical protein